MTDRRVRIGKVKMTRWPWLVPLLTLVLALSPSGLGTLSGLFSADRQAQGITAYIVAFAFLVACALTLVEWVIRILLSRIRAKRAGGQRTEPPSKT